MEDILQFRRFDTPDLHFLSSASSRADFEQLGSARSSRRSKSGRKVPEDKDRLTWIHLRYFPPGLILESWNDETKRKAEKMIDLIEFTQNSNLEKTAQDLMRNEPLFTVNNKPTLVQCLEKLKFKCKPDYRKRFSLRQSIKTHCLPVLGAAISRDGTKCATASFDKNCKIWSCASGAEIASLTGHYDAVCTCTFNNYGDKLLTGSYDNTVRIWKIDDDKHTGECLQTLHGSTGEIQAVEYSSDCLLAASGSTDNMGRVYDLTSGLLMYTFTGHKDDVNNVQLDRSCTTLLTGSFDSQLGLWDLRSGANIEFLQGHEANVLKCSFDFLAEKVASCSADNTVNIWDLRQTSEPMTVITDHQDEVWDVAFNCRGSLIGSVSKDGHLMIWDVKSAQLKHKILAHNGPARQVSFNSSGSLILTSGDDQRARLWHPESGDCFQTLEGHKDKVTYASFNYFGETILTVGQENTTKVWQ